MLYREIQEAVSWDKKLSISMEAKEEVAFWYRSFHKYNGQPIWLSSPKISVLTYSDASSLAWGGYSVNFCGLTAKGNFSDSEMNSSSTWRELSATFNVLHSFINLIEGKVIKHRTDCQNVVRVLNSGSKKFDLQNLGIWFVIFLISALSIIFNSTQNGFLEMKTGMLIIFQKMLTGMTTC